MPYSILCDWMAVYIRKNKINAHNVAWQSYNNSFEINVKQKHQHILTYYIDINIKTNTKLNLGIIPHISFDFSEKGFSLMLWPLVAESNLFDLILFKICVVCFFLLNNVVMLLLLISLVHICVLCIFLHFLRIQFSAIVKHVSLMHRLWLCYT